MAPIPLAAKPTAMQIREMQEADWDSVARIYADGMATGIATFEQELPKYEDWDAAHMKTCRLVATHNNKILGWAALSPVSSRCVYGGVGEVSVYIDPNSQGMGVGKKLMKKLIEESENTGLWTLQSGIFPANIPSVKLHETVGFRYIGKREKVGKINGQWKDNLLFERRSKIVGIE